MLGSGEGGKYLAWHQAKSGRRTGVVERKWISGSCPNTNCMPSKNEIWSAKVADLLHHAAQLGLVTSSVETEVGVRQLKRERFARCLFLKAGQWALDCRSRIPTAEEFLAELFDSLQSFAEGTRGFRRAVADHLPPNQSHALKRLNRRLRFAEKARYRWRKRKWVVRWVVLLLEDCWHQAATAPGAKRPLKRSPPQPSAGGRRKVAWAVESARSVKKVA